MLEDRVILCLYNGYFHKPMMINMTNMVSAFMDFTSSGREIHDTNKQKTLTTRDKNSERGVVSAYRLLKGKLF